MCFCICVFGGNVNSYNIHIIHVDFYGAMISIWWKNDIAQNTPFVWELHFTWYFLCGTVFFRNMKPSVCLSKSLNSTTEPTFINWDHLAANCKRWYSNAMMPDSSPANVARQEVSTCRVKWPSICALGKVGTNMRYKWKYKRRTGFSNDRLF